MPSIDEQAAEWVVRRSAGCSAEDEQAFRDWYAADRNHRGAFLRAEAAWRLLDRSQVLTHGEVSAADIDRVFVEAPVAVPLAGRRPKAKSWLTRRTLVTGAAAASLAGALTTAYVLKTRQSWTTGLGELRNIPLADRSLATINTDSRIDVAMTGTMRHVELVKGEAWFAVAKNPDAPFVVSAGDVRVRALGTAFAVRRRDSGADVLVTEGTVEAWTVKDKQKRVTLSAGNTAFVTNAPALTSVAFEPAEVTRRLAWREREIILKRESLAEAVADFNRYNSCQIVIADPALAQAQLVGGFAVDQPEAFARAVHVMLNAPVRSDGDRIIIGSRRAAS